MARVGIEKSLLTAAAACLVIAGVSAPGASAVPAAIVSTAVQAPVGAWGPVSTLEPGSLGGHVALSADGTRATAIYPLFNDLGDAGEYWATSSATLTSNGVLAWGPPQVSMSGTPQWDYQMALSKDGTRALYAWSQTQSLLPPGVVKVVARTIAGNVGRLGPVQTLTPWSAGEDNAAVSVALSDDGSRAAVVWSHSLFDGKWTSTYVTTYVSLATVVGGATSWSPPIDLGQLAAPGLGRGSSVSLSGDGTRVIVHWSDLSTRAGTIRTGASGLEVTWGPITPPPTTVADVEAFLVSHDGMMMLAAWNGGTATAPRLAVSAATVNGDVATWGPTYHMSEPNARAKLVTLSDDGHVALVTVDSRDDQGLHPVTSVDLLGIGTDASITAGTRASLDGADSITRLSLSANGRIATATSASTIWVALLSRTTAAWRPPTHPFTAAANVVVSADGSHAVALWTVRTDDPLWHYQTKSQAGFPDTTAPVVRMTAPTATFTTSAQIGVAWTVTDGGSGVKFSAVRWTRAPANGGTFAPWTAPASWSALAGKYLTVTAALGFRYCFQVRSTDWSGNTSAWSTPRCTLTPFDDRALAASTQWRHGLDPGWLAGTYSYTTAYGARLSSTHPMSIRQVGVIATTCPTCGTLAVYVGTTRIGTLALRSTTTRARVLLTAPRLTTSRYGPVRFVVVSRSNPVKIDAIALSNT